MNPSQIPAIQHCKAARSECNATSNKLCQFWAKLLNGWSHRRYTANQESPHSNHSHHDLREGEDGNWHDASIDGKQSKDRDRNIFSRFGKSCVIIACRVYDPVAILPPCCTQVSPCIRKSTQCETRLHGNETRCVGSQIVENFLFLRLPVGTTYNRKGNSPRISWIPARGTS